MNSLTNLRKRTHLFGLATLLILSACAQNSGNLQSSSTLSAANDTTEAAVTAVSAIADSFSSGQLGASMKRQTPMERIFNQVLGIQTADAACSKTPASCQNGSASANLSCQTYAMDFSGSLLLQFSDPNGQPLANCAADFVSAGDSVLRTGDISFKAPRVSIQSLTSSHKNYLGNDVSGGAKLTLIGSSGLSLNILGHSYIVQDINGNVVSDVSIQTPNPLSLNQTERAGRTLSGSVRVYHNVQKLTGSLDINNLVWDANCCFPVQGSVAYQSASGAQVNIEFSSCGAGSVSTAPSSASSSSSSSPAPASTFAYQNCSF